MTTRFLPDPKFINQEIGSFPVLGPTPYTAERITENIDLQVLYPFSTKRNLGSSKKWLTSGAGWSRDKMIPEHLFMPESKKRSQKNDGEIPHGHKSHLEGAPTGQV